MYVCPIPKFVGGGGGGGTVDIVSPIFKIVGEGHVPLPPPPWICAHARVRDNPVLYFFLCMAPLGLRKFCLPHFFFYSLTFFFSKTFHCNHCSIACKWLNFIDSIKHTNKKNIKNGLCATRTPDLWFHRAALYQ